MGELLVAIAGTTPIMHERATACAFRDRCEWAIEECAQVRPEAVEPAVGRESVCHRADAVYAASAGEGR
jgi:oligopeptide/dipeptide ABC transporter ATP-binding protein